MTRPAEAGRMHPLCSRCGRESVIRLREPDRHLCGDHLRDEIRERVRKTLDNQRMVEPGDRIAVAYSGGKDSTALLLLLSELLGERADVRLLAVTIDEGIAGYREETIRAAEVFARRQGIEHRIVTFSGLFGNDLDVILRDMPHRACSVCGILRRKALLHAAREAGATKIATGHNLDDEAQSVLMNAIMGDLPRFVRDSSVPSGGCFLPRIKPLMQISEKEIAVYLMTLELFPELPQCPYTRFALRAGIRSGLYALEHQHPGTMRRLVKGREHLSMILDGVPVDDPVRRCPGCGEPCSGAICATCQFIEKSGL